MARLDRMEGGREVAQLAAVLGREFSHELLAAVATAGRADPAGGAGQLVQAEILYPKGRPPRCTYIFKHALLEDALYNALVKAKRQQFHRRIARGAGSAVPADRRDAAGVARPPLHRGGADREGVGYWLKAGQRSRERSAYCEAIGHLTKGLALFDTLAESRTRDDWELQFLTTLAPAYIAARGYAAPEVGPILVRRANCASGSGIRSSNSGSCWACGSGASCAATCGCAWTWPPTGWRSPKV